MATGTSLILKFGTLAGEKTWTFSNVDEEASTASVKTLMNTMIENGSIYKYPPLSKVSAVTRIVREEAYDISDD